MKWSGVLAHTKIKPIKVQKTKQNRSKCYTLRCFKLSYFDPFVYDRVHELDALYTTLLSLI